MKFKEEVLRVFFIVQIIYSCYSEYSLLSYNLNLNSLEYFSILSN